MEYLSTFICLIIGGLPSVGAEPCYNYTRVNDTTLMNSFTRQSSDSGTCSNSHPPGKWFRYVSSKDGVLSTTCPRPTVCSTSNHVWMKGSVPDQTDGKSTVPICISKPGPRYCCDRRRQIEIINCGEFVVYRLNLTFPSSVCTNFCFNSSPSGLSTKKLFFNTTTTTLTTTLIASSSTSLMTSKISTKSEFVTTTLMPTMKSTSTERKTASSSTALSTTSKQLTSIAFDGNSTSLKSNPEVQTSITYAVSTASYNVTSSVTSVEGVHSSTVKYDEDDKEASNMYKALVITLGISTAILAVVCMMLSYLLCKNNKHIYSPRGFKDTESQPFHADKLPDIEIKRQTVSKRTFDISVFNRVGPTNKNGIG